MHSRFLIIVGIFFTLYGKAQVTSNSPFTAYGIGEKGSDVHAAFAGMGNCALTYFDSTVFNVFNPATYNTLGEGQPLFSTGINGRMSFYNQSGNKLFNATAYPDHFALAFTLKKHFGLAFGLKPFTKKGYDITDREVSGSDTIEYQYSGIGNFNQAFIGLSTNLLKFKNTVLSVGGNFSYLFGASNNQRTSKLIDNTPLDGGVNWNELRLSALHYELGAYFKQTIKNNHHFSLAAVIEPSQQLSATKDSYLFYGIIGDPEQYDTLSSTTGVKGKINLPTTFNAGFSYALWFNDSRKNNTFRNSEIAVHVNYSSTDWTTFSSTFESNPYSLSASKLGVGFQYIPERKFLENAVSSKFHEKIRYRAGYYQALLPYSVAGYQLKDQGFTVGIGLPIITQNTLSSLNLGLSFGQRTSDATESLNEQYLSINFGVTIAPSVYERWFRKKKLD